MEKHFIFMYNSYFYKKKIAIHYCVNKKCNNEEYFHIINGIKDRFSHIDFNIHVVYTNSVSIESIYDIDSYFRDVEFIEYRNYKKFINIVKEDTKIDAIDVAKAILCKKSLSNLKLQEILYFVQVKFIEKYNIKLFNDKFKYLGSIRIFPNVYSNYNKYCEDKIIINDKFKVIVFNKLSKYKYYYELLEVIDDVLEKYGDYSMEK